MQSTRAQSDAVDSSERVENVVEKVSDRMKTAKQFVQSLQPVLVRSQAGEGVGTPLLTIEQVATLLCVSPAWVRDHSTRRHPRIPVVRFGGRRALLRFRRQDIEQFIAQNMVQEESV